jgi:hypothetical protein
MERLDRLPDGPPPGQPVCLQQCVPALLSDVCRHLVKQLDRQVSAVTELAQILIPDTSGAIIVTHRSEPLAFMTANQDPYRPGEYHLVTCVPL